ncbi:MAG: hypothetical protein RSD61_03810 [Ruthenibacterium sp.]
MDIAAKIEEITAKIKADPNLGEEFKKDPIKTLEGILGVDLPDEAVAGIVEGLKAKLSSENLEHIVDDVEDKAKASGLGDIIGKAEGFVEGLFGKKE